MQLFILATLLVVSISGSTIMDQWAEFKNFMLAFNKTYINQIEEAKRFANFIKNLRSILEHNTLFEQGLKTWKLQVNKFADMAREEFLVLLGARHKPSIDGDNYVETNMDIPSSIDWRTQGQVTEVKDQGDSCGSCWAFSLTGSIEAAYYREYGELVPLSEQQLMDCSTIEGQGCHGGFMDDTFPYIKENGLESESDYPYTATESSCSYEASKVVTKVSSYIILESGNEDQLLNAVGTIGPVSITMDATYLAFYDSGIYSNGECGTKNLHAMLAVGYDSENGEDYWIIKNSWGSDWGDNGYLKVLRGQNICGIAEDNVYAIIN